jgi:GntR family transcriptional regulator, transcriptional repressor for pyruvate dehydrogenase complex
MASVDRSNPSPRSTGQRLGKVADWVARDLVEDIAARKLAPGSMLPPEAELVERYGVSRPSIREALRTLEGHGLIRMKPGPGGGPVVTDLGPSDYARTSTFFFHVLGVTLRDLAESRMILDPLFARIAAERRDGEVMERLERFVADEPTEPQERHDAIAFHDALACGTGNPVLDLFAGALQALYIERTHSATTPRDLDASRAHHVAIAEAILRGDGAQAEALMRAHTAALVRDVLERFPDSADEAIAWR